ncbi:NAD(P)/FAD-dependent oxidoreductase [Phaeovulum sp. W22_SRMD_FR3]|uniref:NAD(P)/FAD-dependent oxidoreductase n=1 Tax=Phaeovulum sp. W22_SRMD_FR3 TaxID=3240274 RepID=UPI003F951789
MPAPLLNIETASDLPKQADVVVIGGGIIGTTTAYFLAREGLQVALIEKGRIGAEQSSRNWGWCRQQNRDARELPMARLSLQLWEEIAADLGVDLGFRRCGLLYLSRDAAEIETWDAWGKFARGEGVDTRMLSATEANARGRATGQSWKGGVWSPSDGTADPSRAAPLIAAGLAKYGSAAHQNCAARGIETAAGRVTGVITEKGVIATTRVVMAGGAWASSFVNQMGITMPQTTVRSTVVSLQPNDLDLPAALHTAAANVTRRGDGGLGVAISGLARVDPTPQSIRFARHFLPMFARRWRVLTPGDFRALGYGHETRSIWRMDQPTPMERCRTLDPTPDARMIARTLRQAYALLPQLKDVAIQTSWSGYIDCTPDAVPVIDPTVGPDGFVLAAGFSGHGFGIGPGAGRLIADLVLGKTPACDHAEYALARLLKSVRGKVSDF